ncbi:CBS domain-containing protein [Aquirufa nivalisilvae]
MKLDRYTISDHELIEQAIEIIEYNNSRCVIILNNSNKVVGLLSEGDILRSILKGISLKSPVKNIMNTNFKFLTSNDEEQIKNLFSQGITLIPMLNERNELKSILTFTDFIKVIWQLKK